MGDDVYPNEHLKDLWIRAFCFYFNPCVPFVVNYSQPLLKVMGIFSNFFKHLSVRGQGKKVSIMESVWGEGIVPITSQKRVKGTGGR